MAKFAVTKDARNVEEEIVPKRQRDWVQKIVVREQLSGKEKHAEQKQKELLVSFKITDKTIHLNLFVRYLHYGIFFE